MSENIRVLFLCTGIPAGVKWRRVFADTSKQRAWKLSSAGIEAHGLNPHVIKVMKEIGIDISSQNSKFVDELENTEFDYVITACGHTNENCPVFPAKTKVIHQGFDDPPQLAKQVKTEEEALAFLDV